MYARCWACGGAARENAPVEHGVEGRDLVHAHGRHLEELGDIVHNADACPALVLPLTKVEERDDGGLLVLRRVVRDDLLRTLQVLRGELERDLPATVSKRVIRKDAGDTP